MIDPITREAQMQAITQRVASLEITIRKLMAHVDRLAIQIAGVSKGGIGGGVQGGDRQAKFITIQEQLDCYLKSKLTQDQITSVKGVRRDEETALLRRSVICDLFRKGVSINTIAKTLNKNHNTIYYHLTLGGELKLRGNQRYKKRLESKSEAKKHLSKLKVDNFYLAK